MPTSRSTLRRMATRSCEHGRAADMATGLLLHPPPTSHCESTAGRRGSSGRIFLGRQQQMRSTPCDGVSGALACPRQLGRGHRCCNRGRGRQRLNRGSRARLAWSDNARRSDRLGFRRRYRGRSEGLGKADGSDCRRRDRRGRALHLDWRGLCCWGNRPAKAGGDLRRANADGRSRGYRLSLGHTGATNPTPDEETEHQKSPTGGKRQHQRIGFRRQFQPHHTPPIAPFFSLTAMTGR